MLENPPPSQSKAKMTSHTENKTRDVVQLRRFCKTEFPFERFYILYVCSLQQQEENIDLEELEQFAKTFKRRRIELGKWSY